MKFSGIIIIINLFLLLCTNSQAEELLMVRTRQTFPEAMLKLQETIKKHHYTVSRVQRVDIGLTASGYKTDKYRLVFFGKNSDIKYLSENYPELAAYIPWKIAIFAENQDTLLTTANPIVLENDKYPEANRILKRWKTDLDKIFDNMRLTGDD